MSSGSLPGATSVAALLQALVRVRSVNPTGDPGVDDGRQPARGGAPSAGGGSPWRTAGRQAELRRGPARPAQRRWGGLPADRPGKPKLLLCPHLDTVSVRGMTVDPFAAERRDGQDLRPRRVRHQGHGGGDAVGAVRSSAATRWRVCGHEVWFAGLMGEEAGNRGSLRRWRPAFPDADFALVGEPTRCQTSCTRPRA